MQKEMFTILNFEGESLQKDTNYNDFTSIGRNEKKGKNISLRPMKLQLRETDI